MKASLDGMVALVTGAGSGIGRETAVAFAREGASVVVSDIDGDGSKETVRQIKSAGGEAFALKTDVANSAEVKRMVSDTVGHYGRLDFACNNAGIGGPSAPTADYDEESWDTVMNVNLRGVWLCMREEITHMIDHGGGAIVNMASILGTVGFANAPAYVAAKHGVVGLTKAAAIEYAPHNIRVNAVCPAFIVTPLLENAGLMDDEATRDFIVSKHPIGRMGQPEEVAEAVVWLSSPAASFVTGHSMLVDGGYTAQ